MKKFLLLGFALAMTSSLNAAVFVRGGFFAGPRITPFGWYGGWWGPYYGPYLYAPYAVQPNAGEVKIDTKVKEAEVFINGSLAGTAGKLKTMTLPAGSYNIEVREPGRSPFAEKVYVVAGKTIHLYPDMP